MKRIAFLSVLMLVSACSVQKQAVKTVLLEKTEPGLATDGPRYSHEVTVGPKEKSVPLSVSWSAAKDKDDCLRIASIKVERTGGAEDMVISDVALRPVACGSAWESQDPTRFETASLFLKYQTRVGIQKQDFAGQVATLTGTGQLKP